MIFRDSIGIELSARRVAMVHLKASFSGVKVANSQVVLLNGANTPEDLRREIGQSVSRFIKKCGSSSECIFLGIPGDRTIIRHVDLPLAVKENIGDTLGYELEKYIPLPADEVYFDFGIVSENEDSNRLKAFLAAVKRSDLSNYMDMLDDASSQLCGIEPTPVAMVNMLTGRLGEASYGLVRVDEAQIQIIGVADKHLLFTRTLPLTDDRAANARAVMDSLKPIKPSDAGDPPPVIDVFCLGSGITDALLDALARSEDFNFQRLDDTSLPFSDFQLIGAYSVAREGLEKSALGCNLLPVNLRKRTSKLGRYLALTALLLALVTGLAWAGSYLIHQQLAIRDLDRRIETHAKELADIERVQEETKRMQDRIDFIERVRSERLSDLLLLRELTAVMPVTSWVNDLKVKGNDVVIDGFSDSASELIPLLDASPMFTEVAFQSTITKTREGKERFRIGFKISDAAMEPAK